MDSRVWREYVQTVVKSQIDGPSVFFVDNLNSHVSKESTVIVSGELNSQLCPPNSTSMAQSLDVGIIGPLKMKMKAAWPAGDRAAKPTAARKRDVMIYRTIEMANDLSIDAVKSSFALTLLVANV